MTASVIKCANGQLAKVLMKMSAMFHGLLRLIYGSVSDMRLPAEDSFVQQLVT